MRLVVIDKGCVVKREGRIPAGWSLIRREAPSERNYLIHAPTGKLRNLQEAEVEMFCGISDLDKSSVSPEDRRRALIPPQSSPLLDAAQW